MFVSFPYTIIGQHHIYEDATVSASYVNMYYATIRAAYVCKLFLEHNWVKPSYGDATLSAAYVCKHYLQNHWVIL